MPIIAQFHSIKDKVFHNENIKNTIIIATGGFIGSFFSYLLLFFLGRKLSVAEYGLYSTLISLSTIILTPTTIIGVSVIKRVSELASLKEWRRFSGFFWSLIALSALLGLFVFLTLYLLSFYFRDKFQIESNTVILTFALLTGLSFPSGIFGASLQGLMRYFKFSVYNIVSSFLRMAFALLPLYLGLGLVGIFNGMSFALIVSFVFAITLINASIHKTDYKNLKYDYKRLLIFSIPSTLLSITQTFLTNMDMVLVRRYFDPQITGYYAGAVTLGKILLFGCSAVATVMYPQIISAYSQKKNTTRSFKQFFLLQVFVVFVGLLCYMIFPGFISNIFFGTTFSASVPYVRAYAVFITLFVLMNFLALYLLAVEKTGIFLSFFPAMGFQYFYIIFNHRSLYDVVFASGVAVIIIIISLLLSFTRKYPTFLNRLFYKECNLHPDILG